MCRVHGNLILNMHTLPNINFMCELYVKLLLESYSVRQLYSFVNN